MIVKVTQKHINDARQESKSQLYESVESCPVALALDEKYWVGGTVLYSKEKDCEQSWQLPKKVTAFIQAFDNKEKVLPFQFTIEL